MSKCFTEFDDSINMYTSTFYMEVGKEAKLAQTEDGSPTIAYLKISLTHQKEIDESLEDELVQAIFRVMHLNELHEDIEQHLTFITKEKYMIENEEEIVPV